MTDSTRPSDDAPPADLDDLDGLFTPAPDYLGSPEGIAVDVLDPSNMGVVSPRMARLPPTPEMELEPYLDECLSLEPEAISEEFARLPADFARWNELYAQAHYAHSAADLAVRRARARVALRVRRDAPLYASTYKCKVTEGSLADIVACDPEVCAAEDARARADRDRNRIRGILVALKAKDSALVTIGAHQRAELTLTPHIRSTPRDSRRG